MAKICWSESRVVRLRVRTRLGLLPRFCAFIDASFRPPIPGSARPSATCARATPRAMTGQIFLKSVAIVIRKSAHAAHDVQQARFLHQVMSLHQPRKAFDFAEDVANDIDRKRRRLVRDLIDWIRRPLGHLAYLL